MYICLLSAIVINLSYLDWTKTRYKYLQEAAIKIKINFLKINLYFIVYRLFLYFIGFRFWVLDAASILM
jgi:hypothetical protein